MPALSADVEDAFFPTGNLRDLEIASNKKLREYTNLYFSDAHSNAYFFETTDTGFGACFLIKSLGMDGATWDSIHSFTVEEEGDKHSYTLVSTIFLLLAFDN